jgi:hypothetical protein
MLIKRAYVLIKRIFHDGIKAITSAPISGQINRKLRS